MEREPKSFFGRVFWVGKLGALVAAFSKDGKNVVPIAVRMLAALEHRGRDRQGIGTPNLLEIEESVHQLENSGVESNASIGHNLSRILPTDVPQPIQDRDTKLVFEGRFFPRPAQNEAQEIMNGDSKDPAEKAKTIIRNRDGSYAFALLSDHRILVGRDSIGLMPLYYGENERIRAFASERKGLWAVGILNVKSFPPGNLAIVGERGMFFQPVRRIVKPVVKPFSMQDATGHLEHLLVQSFNERVSDVEKISVAFSGGLDSSVLAFLAAKCHVKVQLIYVGFEDHPETHHAESVSRYLELPLQVRTLTTEDVEKVLSKVLWLIEEADILKVSVAIPFYLIAETASRIGNNVLLAGQGSDELFGGYHRYLREYASSGIWSLEDALYRDVASSYETNFERDNKVCSFNSVELRLPFGDYDLIRFSLSLPAHLKISSPSDELRKRVLRETARKMGLPAKVYSMRKRAIQYTTGVDKILRKLARERDLSPRDFVMKSFFDVRAASHY